MVESALVLTVLILVLLALTDVARIVHAYNEMPYLAREGARFAAVHGAGSSAPLTCGRVVEHVRALAVGIDPKRLTVSVNGETLAASTSPLGIAPGSIKVVTTYQPDPVFRIILGRSTTLSGDSEMPYTQ